jgi:4-hydroxybenzoate polyprenyltransferase
MTSSARHPWLELVRPPNLLTIPGDGVAGLLLACAAGGEWPDRPALTAALAAGASLCIYAGGLILNDVCDYREDLRDRPQRPLPSGRVRRGAAAGAALALLLAGVALAATLAAAALYVAAGLVAAVVAYDAAAKRVPLLGPLNMGLCRALSVLVGAAALGPDALGEPVVLAAAGGAMIYVAAVTHLARDETRRQPVRSAAMLIVTASGAWLAALSLTAGASMQAWRWWMTAAGIATLLWATWCLSPLGGRPEPRDVQRAIGALLRGLILMQATAALLAGTPGIYVAAGLAVAFVLNGPLAKRFYAS